MHLGEKEALRSAMMPCNLMRKIDNTLDRVKSFDGSKDNINSILEHDRQLDANGNSLSTRYSYLATLHRLQQFAKDNSFRKLSKQDIMQFFELEKRGTFYDARFRKTHGATNKIFPCESTLNYHRHMIRKFFAYLYNYKKGYPLAVGWIKVKRIGRDNKNKINPSDILSAEEIYAIISHAESPRDKALMSLLAESGCRAGEISTLRIKDIMFNEHGFELTVNGKTGLRTVPLVISRPDVENWLNNFHMFASQPDAPLFPRFNKKQLRFNLQVAGIWNVVKKTVARARLVMESLHSKNVSPHSFRHARATELAALGWTEAMLRVYFGWTSDSSMPSVYIHLSQSDVGKKYYSMYGKGNPDETKSRMLQENKPCPNCGIRNPTGYLTCFSCGKPVNTHVGRQKQDKQYISKMLNAIAADEAMAEKFLGLLQEADTKYPDIEK